jgi:hypothetical protein
MGGDAIREVRQGVGDAMREGPEGRRGVGDATQEGG